MAITLAMLHGCSSELIRLGDQAADVSPGGNGGAAPSASRGGAAENGLISGGGSMIGDGGAASSGIACPHARVLASEVLWIGDSWIQTPGTQHDRVRDLARGIGAIGANEDYANSAAAAASMDRVAKQYETRESGPTKVKVLLMDGGTWDPIAAQMAGSSVSAAIDDSIGRFQQFLDQVESDGTVEQIVYFLVPELSTIPGVATMRPRLQQACSASTVRCHFIDLQPYWAGHPEYTAPDGIQSSVTGAVVIGDLIWEVMQENCIAQ